MFTQTWHAETWRLLKDAFTGWWNDRAMSLGASIAFFTVFSLAPMLLAAIAVAGLAFGREAAQGAIVRELGGLIGTSAASAIEALIVSASNVGSGIVGTTIGLTTFLLLVTGAVVELQDDLNIIWKVKAPSAYGVSAFIHTRLLSMAFVLGIGFLLLVSLVVDTGLSSLGGIPRIRVFRRQGAAVDPQQPCGLRHRHAALRHDLQGPAGREPDLARRRNRRCRHGAPVHDRQVPHRLLPGTGEHRDDLRRRRVDHHDPALDLLLVPHPSLRSRVHQGLCREPWKPSRPAAAAFRRSQPGRARGP